jgi:hypothetical protein
MTEFKAWPKINRFTQPFVTITEKIDGTNACVIVEDGKVIGAQSRSQLLVHDNSGELTKYNDNAGFAQYVIENQNTLFALGDGYHYGEWAGPGIQKNPHNLNQKYFFLFNTGRFVNDEAVSLFPYVRVVPTLYSGYYEDGIVESVMNMLNISAKEKGYIPEGVCIYWHNFDKYSKATFKNSEGKWKSNEAI